MVEPRQHPRTAELRVVVHPAPLRDPRVSARRMDRDHAPWTALDEAGEGIWTMAGLEPGPYLVRFEDEGYITEHQPVDLQRPGAQLDLFAVPRGARRVRIGSRRFPTRSRAEEVDVFLVERADGITALAVLELARREGLRVQHERVVDPGIEALVARLDADDDEAPAVDGFGEAVGKLISRALGRLDVAIDARIKASVSGPIRADLHGRLEVPGERAPGRRGVERFAATLTSQALTSRVSAVIPLVAEGPAEAARAVVALRRSPYVAAAGARISSDREHPVVRRPSILLRLCAGADPEIVHGAMARVWPEGWGRRTRWRPAGPSRRHSIADRYVIELPPDADEVIEDILDAVLQTGAVRWATPDLACRPELHGDASEADELADLQWEHKVMEVDAAHEWLQAYGRSRGGVTLALLDDGVPNLKGRVLHADLMDRVELYDGRGHPDTRGAANQGSHGGKVATVAAATDHPGAGPGTKGVAPDARLKAFEATGPVDRLSEALLAAGYTGSEPADVVIVAMQYPPTAELPALKPLRLPPALAGADLDALGVVGRHGRHGRGCVVVMSSGNTTGELHAINPVATSRDALACGASAFGVKGDGTSEETAAAYGTHGPGLACVAPGFRTIGAKQEPASYAAAVGFDTWPSHALAAGKISGAPTYWNDDNYLLDVVGMKATEGQAIGVEHVPVGARLVVVDGTHRSLWEVRSVKATLEGLALEVWRAKDAKGLGKILPAEGMTVGLCDIRLASVNQTESVSDQPHLFHVQAAADIPEGIEWLSLVDRVNSKNRWTAPLAKVQNWLNGQVSLEFEPGYLDDLDRKVPLDVWLSASSHVDYFGRTSGAAALCGGVAALVLAANPRLTSVEARHIIRESCDDLGIGDKYQGAGRVNALAAVKAALAYEHPRDLHFLTQPPPDGGTRAPYSVDIWAVGAPVQADRLAAWATAGAEGDPPEPGKPTHICVRVRNKGREASLEAWLRIYIAPTRGTAPFVWPTDWTPKSTGSATALAPGTYLIGEVYLPPREVPANGAHAVQIELPTWAGPNGASSWERDVLVEITPHDGRITAHADGSKTSTILTNDNLARRSLRFQD